MNKIGHETPKYGDESQFSALLALIETENSDKGSLDQNEHAFLKQVFRYRCSIS